MNNINTEDIAKEKYVKMYHCQKCLNHGSRMPRRGHKRRCPYAQCFCSNCALVEERKLLNKEISQEIDKPFVANNKEDDNQIGEGKSRRPTCARCAMHIPDEVPPSLKGHKRRCPFQKCSCRKCQLVDRRRNIMAKQIYLRRIQSGSTDDFPYEEVTDKTYRNMDHGPEALDIQTSIKPGSQLLPRNDYFNTAPFPFAASQTLTDASECANAIAFENPEIQNRIYGCKTLTLPLIPASRINEISNEDFVRFWTISNPVISMMYESLGAAFGSAKRQLNYNALNIAQLLNNNAESTLI